MILNHLATPHTSRRRWLIAGGAVVLVGAVAAGGWVVTRGGDKKPVDAAPKKADVLELSSTDSMLVEARELRVMLPISGSLAALNQATVKSKVAAEVRVTPVAEGMRVTRGQMVVQLDAADLRARLSTQAAALDDARARLALARKNQENNLALLKQKFISQNAVDTAQNSVELAEATLKSAQSQLEIARRAVDDAVVRSPIDGIISKRYVQPGEKAAPDMPLFAVVNLQQLILEAAVPASEIPKVVPGQQVGFNVEGFGKRAFAGRVARINPSAETGSRAILVYIAVDNADGALKSGMFAKGGITLEKAAPQPLIPTAALRQQNGAPMVLRIEGRTVVAQPVTLGLRNDDEGLVQVVNGLAAGNRVIVVRLENVKTGGQVRLPGDAAKVVAPAPAPAPAKG
ncbi:MAG: efflux RND transporter periplasmic adaptor subunit [Herminiimonas sp.]|nr:efflux RND transporter periplasmic adaptor subunit [Herminiimonas sp.]